MLHDDPEAVGTRLALQTTMKYVHLTLEHLGHINSPAEYLPPLPLR